MAHARLRTWPLHEGVALRLVTAWEVPAMGRVNTTAGELDVSGVYRNSARGSAEGVRDHLGSLGCESRRLIAEGSAITVVAQTADIVDASLVVIGSRAGRGVRDHLMGLLRRRSFRGCSAPVLVVRGQSRTGLRGRSSSWIRRI